jgi:hypothetical protein
MLIAYTRVDQNDSSFAGAPSALSPMPIRANPTHRPTLPTSKYWLPVLPRRPGVLRPMLFLASFVEVAAAMLRGMRFSFSGSSVSNYVL